MNEYISKILHVESFSKFIPPYMVAKLLYYFKKFSVNSHVITKFRLIIHLVEKKLVPVKKTTLYTMIERYSGGLIDENATWSELTKQGTKPYLTHRDFNSLVLSISNKTSGGLAFSISEIRNEIKKAIKE